MKKVWFFDLEETIILSWNDPVLVNKDRVTRFIEENSIKEITIFSAAIWNDEDKSHFHSFLKPWLEDVFKVSIVDVISMTDVWVGTSLTNIYIENIQELLSLFGKRRMFEVWCLEHSKANTHCVLLDDAFGNTLFINKDLQVSVETVDVTKLPS